MISVPEVVVERVAALRGDGTASLDELALRVTDGFGGDVGGVIAATFSHAERFPSLAVRIASVLKLPASTPAFDLQMACSAYPYAVYLAGKIAADTGKRVLVVDGDVHTPLIDSGDKATFGIFSDAVTASFVRVGTGEASRFAFLSRHDTALVCPAGGPLRMDGFKVFTFVATEVREFLAAFGADFDWFVPHQANPYMVRQLARSLKLEEKLVTVDETVRNPGSCSVPLALAALGRPGRVLLAGFGAGFSVAAGIVRFEAQ